MIQPSSRRLLAVGMLTAAAALAVPALPATSAGANTAHAGKADKAKGAQVRMVPSKKYGKILVSSSGRTLYVLVSGSGASLPCGGTCASLWPPLLTKGKPHGVRGLRSKLLGTKKHGKSLQVTYKHHPLFMYAGDSGKGQFHGEGIKSFGGTWYVLSLSGSPVKAATSSSGGSGGYGSSGGTW